MIRAVMPSVQSTGFPQRNMQKNIPRKSWKMGKKMKIVNNFSEKVLEKWWYFSTACLDSITRSSDVSIYLFYGSDLAMGGFRFMF